MIDFSAIPNAKNPSGPWDSLKLAIIIFFSISSIVVLGALITVFTSHRDITMILISGTILLGFIGLIIRAFIKGFRSFNRQKKWMQEFAKENNWQYDESKRNVNDLAAYPPLYADLASNWNNVRCTVSGKLNGNRFELAHITYVQPTSIIGILLYNYSHYRFRVAWTSVLRLEGHPNLHERQNFVYESDASYTYVICGLNALYRADIQTMFESVA